MLGSLLDSLEMGLHEDEVVVPVHRYLPSIKVRRPLPEPLLLPEALHLWVGCDFHLLASS